MHIQSPGLGQGAQQDRLDAGDQQRHHPKGQNRGAL
jgi:hypothetical protein